MANAGAEVGSTANSYQILGKLAVGGMAEIFLVRRATGSGVERHCVLKRILPERAGEPRFVQMFLDEARLATQLQHPNIASVYDIGMLDDSYFYTMEYVHGDTIQSLLRRARALHRPLPLACVLTILAGAASGLHHAHERTADDGRPLGIVHRDVSPSNVMVSYEGSIKLVDFGVAKASGRTVQTTSGTVKGKIGYLSPEQCRCATVDRRSDLFSLGIVAWEMLTGARLYRRASDFDSMLAIVEEAPALPSALRSEVPPAVDDIVSRLLAKSLAGRFQTAAEVVEAIENAALGAGTMLSTVAVSRLMQDVFGPRAEPWRELERAPPHGDPVTLVSRPIPEPIADAPAAPGPATASVEVSASVAGLPDPAPMAHLAESPPSPGAEPIADGTTTSLDATMARRRTTARRAAWLAGGVVIALATAIWLIAPARETRRHAEPAPPVAGVDLAGAAPADGPPRVAPAVHSASSPDRAVAGADMTRPAASARHPAPVEAASRIPASSTPVASGTARPSLESIRRAYDAGAYAGVVAACRAMTVTRAIAEFCTRAACQQHDVANVQRWLPINPAPLIGNLVDDCRAAGNKVIRTPVLDCSKDLLDCR